MLAPIPSKCRKTYQIKNKKTMKRTYYAVLAIAIGFSTMLYSCGTDNTTGVETESIENEEMNQENEGEMLEDNTTLDTTNTMEQ